MRAKSASKQNLVQKDRDLVKGSNPDSAIDQQIGYLESRLGASSKGGAELLEKELKKANLFELFTCVDHILGKKKSDKKYPQTREEYEQALREMEQEEAQEEDDESGDIEHQEQESHEDIEDGDFEQEDFAEEAEGEEEYADQELDEEESAEIQEVKVLKNLSKKPDSTNQALKDMQESSLSNPLGKRKPDNIMPRELASQSQVFEHDISPEKIEEIVKTLLEKPRENKELLTQINKLCGSIHRLKLNGKQFAKATLKALEIPPNHKIPKPDFKKEEKSKPKSLEKPKQSVPAKLVDSAVVKDRLRSALYAASMFANKFTSEFSTQILGSGNTRWSLWTLSGLFSMGLVKGKVLMDWLSAAGHIDATSSLDMEKIVHLVASPIRAQEPSLFKSLAALLLSLYPTLAQSLHSLLDKLRNNLTLPGTSPFDLSKTVLKLLEKDRKKRRGELIVPFESLDSLMGIKTKPIVQAAETDPSLKQTLSQIKSSEQKDTADNAKLDPVLQKLAERLDLVTKVEIQSLKIVTGSPEYIEVVHALLGLNTHGSENKELAGVVLKCCLHEKQYNPFYAAIAKKICFVKEMFKYSFQLALWEEIQQEAEAEGERESTPGMINKLSSFAWEMMVDGYLDHRFFKFLDTDPLPKCSAILAKKLVEKLVSTLSREKLRTFSKKLAKLDSVARNAQKVVKYLQKQKLTEGQESELATTLKRMESWLEYTPNFDDPDGAEEGGEMEPQKRKGKSKASSEERGSRKQGVK
jgi:MA3 domain